ncbi:MAG TPA: hypothetical protein VN811_16440 [Thermoanaerobaculia bacterium]|nr:hypothetical protein [Thermoanaerobaculia bacterium]
MERALRCGSGNSCRWRLAAGWLAVALALSVAPLRGAQAPASHGPGPAARTSATTPAPTLAGLLAGLRDVTTTLAPTAGMKAGYAALLRKNGLTEAGLPYADFVAVRLLYEATRDAGFWNLQWRITNREPRSDEIWKQWQRAGAPTALAPTATAECDELSAVFAFLARSLGVRGVGLFWPTWNHTVAVWQIRTPTRPPVRVVVPTSQIFLAETDTFGTDRFDPWRQRDINEYTRRDAPADLRLPAPLVAFFLAEAKRYGGASDDALQRLRYLREALFLRRLTPPQAAALALRAREQAVALRAPREDLAAFEAFAREMRQPR